MMPFTRQLVDDIDQFWIPRRMFQESSVGAGATSDSGGLRLALRFSPHHSIFRRTSLMNCMVEALLDFFFAGVCCWKWVMADAHVMRISKPREAGSSRLS
jgi:hypothetical protein